MKSVKLDRKVGNAPGDTKFYGKYENRFTKITQVIYNETEFVQKEIFSTNELEETENSHVNWIDIEGFGNLELIKEISTKNLIHDMLLEDIFNTIHLPKYEESEEYLLFVLKNFQEKITEEYTSHVVILLKDGLVMSFRENPNDLLPPKIERIKNSKGRARRKGSDYLFFILLDTFIDSYYYYFEHLRGVITEIDNKILDDSNINHIKEIYSVKSKLTAVRRNLFPLKTSINEFLTTDSDLINYDNLKYFNDCKDHINELIEYYHSFGEMITSLITLNENNINNSTNKVMKVLTIIATIFIPLTFIVGIYGMNFKYMPELSWKYGYFFILLVMLGVVISTLIIIKLKKWY